MTEPAVAGAVAPEPIAIIGLAGRYPGANSVERFWANLCGGVESISRFSGSDLLCADQDPAHVLHPGFVGAEGTLAEDPGLFDAEFFGYPPREAALMDPQHRMCLELAWEAFDTAGYDPSTVDAPVGVFLSVGLSSYLVRNLLAGDRARQRAVQQRDGLHLLMHNDKDFAASTVSYRLGLTGPSLAVGSACSSSLVAVHLAVRSLQDYECDLALAGGAYLQVPHGQGHVHTDDSVYSPDGRCAAFDATASGTVGGSGAGLVLLKRLAEARRDGDDVVAVIIGSAVNNDGAAKPGYTAPSAAGQAAVIAEAHAAAGVGADTIGYVEAHGTGTTVGDAIEVEALTGAFRAAGDGVGYCALGSVKTNIGHLDAAAGIAGLTKAALAVRHGMVPASLHFTAPNPALELERSPFRVPAATAAWSGPDRPRRAGVSAFGIGGTNAHIVLEQPPAPLARDRTLRPEQALLISARGPAELTALSAALAARLRAEPALDLADVAGTLAGRRHLPYRRAVICRDAAEAATALDAAAPPAPAVPDRPVVLVFTGDDPVPTLDEPALTRYLDECAAAGAPTGEPARRFCLQYALGRALLDFGVRPAAVVGHGAGELPAAVLAGLLPLTQALRLLDSPDPALVPGPETAPSTGGPRYIGGHAGPLSDRLARCADLGPAALVTLAAPAGPTEVPAGLTVVPAVPRPGGTLTPLLARLWAGGSTVDWAAVHRPQRTVRVPLPGGRLSRRRHWVDPPALPVPVPDVAELAGQLRTRVAAEPDPVRGIDEYPGLRAGLDRLCATLAGWYLHRGGIALPAGARLAVPDLAARLGVRAPFHRLLDTLLDALAADGVLARDGDAVTVRRAVDPSTVDDAAVAAEAGRLSGRYPGFAGLVELLVHCVRGYPRALSEPAAALGVLYPDGTGDLLARTLGATVEHRAVDRLGGLLGDLLDRLAAGLDRPVRVLEVGAGEGSLTRILAGRLQPDRVVYRATDVSAVFAAGLAARAAQRGLTGLRTGVLDIAVAPAAQGYAGHRYDLICGLDVVHATPDLHRSLANLRAVLAPGGVLALVETTAPDRWLSLIWGLSQSWWSYTDRREYGPLRSAGGWREVLRALPGGGEVIEPPDGPRDAALVLFQEPGGLRPAAPAVAAPAPATAIDAWPAKRPDLSAWCYRPGWRHLPPARPAPVDPGAVCLLAGVPAGVRPGDPAGALVAELRQRLEPLGVTVIEAGTAADGCAPVRLVVHLGAWSDALHRGGSARADEVFAAQAAGVHAVTEVARALDRGAGRAGVRMVALTTGVQDVLGGEVRHPEHAAVASAAKVMPREYPWLACTALDVAPDAPVAHVAGYVVDELLAARETGLVAYRGRHRFGPHYLADPLDPVPAGGIRPRLGGTYLICGGLGGIGLSLAEYLGAAPARLVLTARRDFPPPQEWAARLAATGPADPTGRTIRRLVALREAGAQVIVARADVTDAAAMCAVIERAERSFGPLTGVVHAAGLPDTAGVIARRTAAETDAATAAKTRGALVLDEAVGDRPLEFFAVCSSIGTVLHKLKFGELGYVAANDFVNAFAEYRSARRPGLTVAIAWSDWLAEGMWAEAQERLAGRYARADELGSVGADPTEDILGGLTHAEGVEVFARLLGHRVGPRVVVSTQDLDDLLARHEAFTTADHLAAVSRLRIAPGSPAVPAVPEPPAPAAAELPVPAAAERPVSPAANGSAASAGPPGAGAVRHTLAGFWCTLLGVAEVGATDDFFDLGGDSLVGLRLLAMIRDEYGVDLPIGCIFESSTVTALAEVVIRALGAGRGDREEVVL